MSQQALWTGTMLEFAAFDPISVNDKSHLKKNETNFTVTLSTVSSQGWSNTSHKKNTKHFIVMAYRGKTLGKLHCGEQDVHVFFIVLKNFYWFIAIIFSIKSYYLIHRTENDAQFVSIVTARRQTSKQDGEQTGIHSRHAVQVVHTTCVQDSNFSEKWLSKRAKKYI